MAGPTTSRRGDQDGTPGSERRGGDGSSDGSGAARAGEVPDRESRENADARHRQALIGPLEYMYQASRSTFALVDGAVPAHELQVFRNFLRLLNEVCADMVTQARAGKPLVGTHFAFPSELLHAFDAVPVVFETLSYATSAFFTAGTEADYDRAIAYGHPYHTCTSQKGVIGMALRDAYFDVDAIAIPTSPCDNTMSSYQFFSEVQGVPTVVADMPYLHDARGYAYFAGQLEAMINELAGILEQAPDYDRFRAAIRHSSDAIRYLAEINDLRAAVPCPVESMFNPLGSMVQNFFAGRPQKAEFYRHVRDLARARVKRGSRSGGLESEEKIRSVWPYMSVFFSVEIYEWMDRQLGMSNVCDAFNHFFFDPIDADAPLETILAGLARQSMEYPMTRQSESFCDVFLEDAVFLCKKYKADCAIFTAHLGCKQSVSIIQLMREVLKDELGIPMLTIELDIGDKRMTPAAEIKRKLAQFAETLL